MCGIAGFSNAAVSYQSDPGGWNDILNKMNQIQKHRGPDEEGTYLDNHCALAHVRLSIIDLTTGKQPITRQRMGRSCTIVLNGEIYNMHELREELTGQGAEFETTSDTEVVLVGYMQEGIDFIKKLNGIFSLALWDDAKESLFLVRDRLGVKPLFYTILDHTLVFSSELKGIFEYPGISPVLDRDGLCEVFALGPAKTYGKGVFKDIQEVLPGHYLVWSHGNLTDTTYWQLESHPHEGTYEQTVEKTAWLIEDAVKKQMLADIPISTLLSGGVDSSLVTAICAKELKKQGKVLDTFSFDFKENHRHFKSNSFQPSEDRPWVDKMVAHSGTNHHYLECDNSELVEYLFKAVDARDLPCMADVESSLLYFCGKVVKHNKVTLTGECADEIFGGYPWFHKQEMWASDRFPWSMSMEPRQVLLKDDLISQLPMDEYAAAAYQKTIGETPLLSGETAEEKRRREISFLNLKWFMVTLLDRMDRTSMHTGLEARVPFADHRIVEYLWNVPWNMKFSGGVVKGLLRDAGASVLPAEVLWRKKSPYPKTYNPHYEKLLGSHLMEVLADPGAPIRDILDVKKAEQFIKSPSDYGKPWYGQLMAGPQMLAYMLQVNYWLEKYNITIV